VADKVVGVFLLVEGAEAMDLGVNGRRRNRISGGPHSPSLEFTHPLSIRYADTSLEALAKLRQVINGEPDGTLSRREPPR
jgi:hypothetical protein